MAVCAVWGKLAFRSLAPRQSLVATTIKLDPSRMSVFLPMALAALRAPSRLRADGASWALEDSPTDGPVHAVRDANPLFTWAPLADPAEPGAAQDAFELRVWDDADGTLVWRSGMMRSPLSQMRYPHGAPSLRPATTYVFDVYSVDSGPRSQRARFHVPPVDWSGVSWLGSDSHNIYRSSFPTPSRLRSAVLYICALGFARVWLNGHPLFGRTLAVSPWTRNSRRNGFSSIEIGHLLGPPGQNNTLGVELGFGWRSDSLFRHNLDGDVAAAGTVARVLRAMVVATVDGGGGRPASGTGLLMPTISAGEGEAGGGNGGVMATAGGETGDMKFGPGGAATEVSATARRGLDVADGEHASESVLGTAPSLLPTHMGSHTASPRAPPGIASSLLLSHTGNGRWQAARGPTLYDDLYGGEIYDARVARAMGGWADPIPFNHGAVWVDATRLPVWDRSEQGVGSDGAGTKVPTAPAGRMVPWAAPPIAVERSVPPVSFWRPAAGLWVFDFGSNLAGVVELSGLVCAAGSNLTITHGEILQHASLPNLPSPDPARVYTANLRTARQTDVYICAGASSHTPQRGGGGQNAYAGAEYGARGGAAAADTAGEGWAPRLTYHGFRYAEIRSSDPALFLDASRVRLLHLHSATPRRSQVFFSSSTLNRLQAMAVGAQRSNLMSIPTDCPQRDERLGWLGDASLSAESISLNFEAGALLSGFVDGMVDEMGDDGSMPAVAPSVCKPRDGGQAVAVVRPRQVGAEHNGRPRMARLFRAEHGESIFERREGVGGLGCVREI
jgi:hypothetical protein